jgi:hypothetical protein
MLEDPVDHVGDGLEAAVRVPRRALGLAGGVVNPDQKRRRSTTEWSTGPLGLFLAQLKDVLEQAPADRRLAADCRHVVTFG